MEQTNERKEQARPMRTIEKQVIKWQQGHTDQQLLFSFFLAALGLRCACGLFAASCGHSLVVEPGL